MAELNSSPEKSGRKRFGKRTPLRVDLTAMVDLAFLLITFFMLTTSLIKPKAMPLVMPVAVHPEPVSENRTMTICLGKNNQLLWYLGMAEKPLIAPQFISNGNGLRTAIIETGKRVLAATGKSLIVLIKPAEHSVYANLVDVLDEVDITKVPTYAIVDISKTDIDLLKQKGMY
ncbi:MAG TPA: biopolymer transporter ExbD [Mucilaginibacter sp.]|jgi:biopolymer transport protein ExbD